MLTLLILFFSEIIPKTLGATYWQQLLPYSTYILKWMIFVLYPFVIISNWLTKITGRKEDEKIFTRQDFSALAKIGMRIGVFNKEESGIIQSLVDFDRITVKKILTPRTVIKSVDENITVEQFYKKTSRLPFPEFRFIKIIRITLRDLF